MCAAKEVPRGRTSQYTNSSHTHPFSRWRGCLEYGLQGDMRSRTLNTLPLSLSQSPSPPLSPRTVGATQDFLMRLRCYLIRAFTYAYPRVHCNYGGMCAPRAAFCGRILCPAQKNARTMQSNFSIAFGSLLTASRVNREGG